MGRRANGEGTIYKTIKKNKKNFDNTKMCAICINCDDRSLCNNRLDHNKCKKCEECKTECLKYCDRFYCYPINVAQITYDGKRKSAGTAKNQKEAQLKKEKNTKKINYKKDILNGNYSLIEAMKFNENQKLKYQIIGGNSYKRNIDTISAISKHPSSQKIISELTTDDIKDILSYFVEIKASQSQLEKVYDEIKGACKECKVSNVLFEDLKRNTFVSDVDKSEVVAFSLEEEKKLIEYLNVNENILVSKSKCNIDSISIKNIIKLALATGMRIGEICCLDKNKDIDKIKKLVIVSKTLTQDENGNIIIGKYTKTGKKNKQSGKVSTRYIPFDILFEEEEIISIYEEQLKIVSNYSENEHNLLFCTKTGNFISHSSINSIFKKICREAGIKNSLPKGCNIHMTKHTAVTRMLEMNYNIYAISALVGTSVEVLHKTYAHILDSFIEDEIKKSKTKRKDMGLTMNVSEFNNCKIIPFNRVL